MTHQMLEKLVTLVSPGDSLATVVQRMAEGKVAYFGLAVVVDSKYRVLGVINDGDFLRLLARRADLSQSVESAMVKDPVTVRPGLSHEDIIHEVRRQLRARDSDDKESVRYVLVTEEDNTLVNVFRFVDLLAYYKRFGEKVAIYGQGFVGLTLAAALANRGHTVTGIDLDGQVIARLSRGEVHIFEPGLVDTVKASLERGTLSFQEFGDYYAADIHIIAVGSPVDDEGNVDLSAIRDVCSRISDNLKRGDVVMLRSTVPAGTTRNAVRPLLEERSGLQAGHDFYLAFTPERTVEGRAMSELRSLPQIVGGLTPVCAQKASTFWATLTDSVVHVDGLEAAELVKLLNNSFRDLCFSFSNAFALLCDKYNLDAFQVVNAANEGYPRNRIPSPSPGVGGYCLTKDPFLYAVDEPGLGHAQLARTGRMINRAAAEYPVKALQRYVQKTGRTLAGLNVLIVGVAFKGWPETNDVRGSTSLETARLLKEQGAVVMGWDAVVTREEIGREGIEPRELHAGCQVADALLILNNHPRNTPEGLLSMFKGRTVLIFDGWSMLDPRDVEQVPGLTYATMGYMSASGR